MKKVKYGILFGFLAGIVDVIPMILQGLTWDANLSAFSMWVVIGILYSITEIEIHPVLKGILIAYLVLLPSAFIIVWKEPMTIVPILIITTILSSILGFTINKFIVKKAR